MNEELLDLKKSIATGNPYKTEDVPPLSPNKLDALKCCFGIVICLFGLYFLNGLDLEYPLYKTAITLVYFCLFCGIPIFTVGIFMQTNSFCNRINRINAEREQAKKRF
jgi:hypothetical protein